MLHNKTECLRRLCGISRPCGVEQRWSETAVRGSDSPFTPHTAVEGGLTRSPLKQRPQECGDSGLPRHCPWLMYFGAAVRLLGLPGGDRHLSHKRAGLEGQYESTRPGAAKSGPPAMPCFQWAELCPCQCHSSPPLPVFAAVIVGLCRRQPDPIEAVLGLFWYCSCGVGDQTLTSVPSPFSCSPQPPPPLPLECASTEAPSTSTQALLFPCAESLQEEAETGGIKHTKRVHCRLRPGSPPKRRHQTISFAYGEGLAAYIKQEQHGSHAESTSPPSIPPPTMSAPATVSDRPQRRRPR